MTSNIAEKPREVCTCVPDVIKNLAINDAVYYIYYINDVL